MIVDGSGKPVDIHDKEIEEAAHTWAKALCECAGHDEAYADKFWQRLVSSEGVYSEFICYMLTQNFECSYNIDGVTIVDIMVWQVDLFKAGMDMGRPERDDPDSLLLAAFNTMLDMQDDPETFLAAYRHDTGTDYPGKF